MESSEFEFVTRRDGSCLLVIAFDETRDHSRARASLDGDTLMITFGASAPIQMTPVDSNVIRELRLFRRLVVTELANFELTPDRVGVECKRCYTLAISL